MTDKSKEKAEKDASSNTKETEQPKPKVSKKDEELAQAKAQAEAKAGTLSAAISPMAVSYLEQTGLMGPQVDTLPEPFITDWWW